LSGGGDVTDAKAVNTVGMGLDERAVEVVRRWKFKPATKDGKPVAVKVTLEVEIPPVKAAHLVVSFLIGLQAVQRTVKFVAFLSKLRQAKGAGGISSAQLLVETATPLKMVRSENCAT
jgi:TonB family protein